MYRLKVVPHFPFTSRSLSTDGALEAKSARFHKAEQIGGTIQRHGFINLSRGVVTMAIEVLSVMFLLWIVFILLLIGVERGKARAFVRSRRHWFRLDRGHGDLLYLWLCVVLKGEGGGCGGPRTLCRRRRRGKRRGGCEERQWLALWSAWH